MRFPNIIIACMVLLMAALSDAQQEPVKRSVRSTTCSLDRIVDQLNRIEEKINKLKSCASTSRNETEEILNCTGDCRIDAAAYGYDDEKKLGYIFTNKGSSDQIYVSEEPQRNRGVMLYELDLTTCMLMNRTHYDTYRSKSDRDAMLAYLESAETGTIIIGVTADSAENVDEFQTTFFAFFASYNVDISGLTLRGKLVCLIVKGFANKSVYRVRARDQGSLVVRIQVCGSTAEDVYFTVL